MEVKCVDVQRVWWLTGRFTSTTTLDDSDSDDKVNLNLMFEQRDGLV
jgi:hypothetical protein